MCCGGGGFAGRVEEAAVVRTRSRWRGIISDMRVIVATNASLEYPRGGGCS